MTVGFVNLIWPRRCAQVTNPALREWGEKPWGHLAGSILGQPICLSVRNSPLIMLLRPSATSSLSGSTT